MGVTAERHVSVCGVTTTAVINGSIVVAGNAYPAPHFCGAFRCTDRGVHLVFLHRRAMISRASLFLCSTLRPIERMRLTLPLRPVCSLLLAYACCLRLRGHAR